MPDIAPELRRAARRLLRRPAFALTVVLTLAVGIGANVAVFSVVDGVLLRPLPYPDPERLVRLFEVSNEGRVGSVAEANFADWTRSARTWAGAALYNRSEQLVQGGSEPVRAQTSVVTDGFFELLGLRTERGRGLAAGDHRADAEPVAVVSQAFWRGALGGEPDLSRLRLRVASQSYQVVGVLAPGLGFPPEAEIWVPRERTGPQNPSRSAHNWNAMARLRAGVAVAAANDELRAIHRRLKQEHGDKVDATDTQVVGLAAWSTARVRPALLLLMAAVAALLLVACANVANLVLAEHVARRGELAVRAALGASGTHLLRQFLAEGLLLALPGGLLGTLLAAAGLVVLTRGAGGRLPRIDEVGLDARALTFALALCLATALLSALLPAWRATGGGLHELLKGAGRGQTGGAGVGRLRAGLVVSQVALTLVLLAGGGLLTRSFWHLLSVDLGFGTDGRLVVDLVHPSPTTDEARARLAALHTSLLERVSALPGVVAVGGVNLMPLAGGDSNGAFQIEGGAKTTFYPSFRIASPGYFGAIGVPLVKGRLFDATDGPGTPGVALISEGLARRVFPGEDPIGRRIDWGNMDGAFGVWATIVGVVGDVRHFGPEADPRGAAYLHYAQRPHRTASFSVVARTSGDPAALAAPVRQVVRELDPTLAPRLRTLGEMKDGVLSDRRFALALLGVFGVTALTLALLGMYGVMAYTVAQRTQEIGVRLALGAEPGHVLWMVLADASRLVGLGLGLGLVGALAASRGLDSLVAGVSARDPLTLALVATLLAGLALVSAFAPARRAALVDPLTALAGTLPSGFARTAEPEAPAARAAAEERDLLAEVARDSAGAADADALLGGVLERVRAGFGARHVALFVREDGPNGVYRGCALAVLPGAPVPDDVLGEALSTESPLLRRLRRHDAALDLRPGDLDAWAASGAPDIALLRRLEAALAAPVSAGGGLAGVLLFGPSRGGTPWTRGDSKLAAGVARQVGLAVDNARLLRRVADQAKLERELKMAQDVQGRLFPAHAPSSAAWETAGLCLPARGVAGDYYDFVPLAGGALGLAIADVAGKGMPAALLMSALRSSLRSVARTAGPVEVAHAVNELLIESADGAYATLFYARLSADGRALDYVNAGHLPPLVARADGRLESLTEGGPVVGLLPAARYELGRAELGPGDLLVAFTDGLSELADAAEEEWGVDRLASAVATARGGDAREVLDQVLAASRRFAGQSPQPDDLTLMVLRVR